MKFLIKITFLITMAVVTWKVSKIESHLKTKSIKFDMNLDEIASKINEFESKNAHLSLN